MSNFNGKSNALREAEIILRQCDEREKLCESKIRENITQKNFLNGRNEKRVKEIYQRQKRKIKFWKNLSIITLALLIISIVI